MPRMPSEELVSLMFNVNAARVMTFPCLESYLRTWPFRSVKYTSTLPGRSNITRLPPAHPPLPSATTTTPGAFQSAPMTGDETLLVVEDNAAVRSVLSAMVWLEAMRSVPAVWTAARISSTVTRPTSLSLVSTTGADTRS